MPATLPIPSWLNPPDYVGSFLKGAQIGEEGAASGNKIAASMAESQARLAQEADHQSAQISLAQQKMQEQAQQSQMAAQVQQQRLAQQNNVEQQKIEISKAYHDSQMGLQQQKLEEAKQQIQQKVQQAAQKSASMMEYEQRVKSGEDPNKVLMEIGPRMGATASGMASVSRASQAAVPKDLELRKEGDQTFYRSSPTERYQHVPTAPVDKALGNTIASHTMSQISKIEEELAFPDITKKQKASLQQSLVQKKRTVNQILKDRHQNVQYPEVESGSSGSGGATHLYIPGQGIVPIKPDQQQPDEEAPQEE